MMPTIGKRAGSGPKTRAAQENHRLAGAARRWLLALQRCVRAGDYAAARRLFAADTYSFGTYATVVRGREALERSQWKRVWPRIRNFTFRRAQARCLGSAAGLCVIVPWHSLGVNPDGATFARQGRATLFLALRGGRWVALHSHFSLAPRTTGSASKRRAGRSGRAGLLR